MLKIAMVDDERHFLDMLSEAFQSAFSARNEMVDIASFTDPLVFLATLSDTHYDLVCLAIIMEGMNGQEVAAKIREKDAEVSIVFISSNETKVFSCFEYNPVGFIRKNNFSDDSTRFIDHFLKTVLPQKKTTRTLMVKIHRDNVFINVDKILYIEGNHNYQTFHLSDEEKPIDVRELMSTLQERLVPYGFIRVHKGFLVNCAAIFRIGTAFVTLKDGTEIPLSSQRRDEILHQYMEYSKNTVLFS